jgi:uncharacterized protein YjbJ (UPF0337 family)
MSESSGNTGQAQEKAKEVAGQAQEKMQGAAQEARGQVRDQVDQRSTQAGEQVRSAAQDVRSVASQMRGQGRDTPARYAEQAADRVESAGDWLRDSDGDTILRDVERFGRSNPWAVVAGGLAIGFAASRLLKASSSERYRSSASAGNGRRSPVSAPNGGPGVSGATDMPPDRSFETAQAGPGSGSSVGGTPR